ncbi:hypothetical protein C8R43DRAFT_963223 [Mycena crocata]|nr:hypothetical protein C8R43DRAFT_963223 [Mycena crocata]
MFPAGAPRSDRRSATSGTKRPTNIKVESFGPDTMYGIQFHIQRGYQVCREVLGIQVYQTNCQTQSDHDGPSSEGVNLLSKIPLSAHQMNIWYPFTWHSTHLLNHNELIATIASWFLVNFGAVVSVLLQIKPCFALDISDLPIGAARSDRRSATSGTYSNYAYKFLFCIQFKHVEYSVFNLVFVPNRLSTNQYATWIVIQSEKLKNGPVKKP